MSISACASLFCLRSHIPQQLKLVEADDRDSVSDVIDLISEEVKQKEKKVSYALETFNLEAAVEDTSRTFCDWLVVLCHLGSLPDHH